MKRFNIILFLILCLFLSVLVFLRWQAKEESAVPVNAKTAPPAIPSLILSPIPTPTPALALSPIPTPKSSPAPSPLSAPESDMFIPPQGYTEESYNLVSDMVYAYADRQDAAADMIQSDLEQLTGALREDVNQLLNLLNNIHSAYDEAEQSFAEVSQRNRQLMEDEEAK